MTRAVSVRTTGSGDRERGEEGGELITIIVKTVEIKIQFGSIYATNYFQSFNIRFTDLQKVREPGNRVPNHLASDYEKS